jgi:hypothetical protein
MFELRNSGENRRKRSKNFFENLPRAYKDLNYVKKKIINYFMLVCLYPRENERRESFIAVHVIRAHLLPPSSAIQREERAREGGIVVVSRGEEGESDPEKTTAKKRALAILLFPLRPNPTTC